MIINLHFDGSCWPNPGGTAKFGYTLRSPDVPDLCADEHGWAGSGVLVSNNFAEFYALGHALFHVQALSHFHTIEQVYVFGDSQLVINIMRGKYKASKDKLYYPEYNRCMLNLAELYKKNIDVEFQWIPREQNTECDELSKKELPSLMEDSLLDEAEAFL